MLIGANKGDGVAGFLLGLFLGVIGIIIIALTAGIKCPYCQTKIHKNAIICPKCNKDLITNKQR